MMVDINLVYTHYNKYINLKPTTPLRMSSVSVSPEGCTIPGQSTKLILFISVTYCQT